MVTGRPGPVVLDVPFDIFKEDAGDAPDPRESSANISCRCGADPENVPLCQTSCRLHRIWPMGALDEGTWLDTVNTSKSG